MMYKWAKLGIFATISGGAIEDKNDLCHTWLLSNPTLVKIRNLCRIRKVKC